MSKAQNLQADKETAISSHLARRLRPLALAIGLLMSFGIPGVFCAVSYTDKKITAAYYSKELAARVQQMALGNPQLWKYQTEKYIMILGDFLPNKKDLAVIHVLDSEGRTIAGFEYRSAESKTSFNLLASNEPEPVFFNNRYIGSAQIGISLLSTFTNALAVFLVSSSVGLAFAAVIYHYPVKVASGLELRLGELMHRLRSSRGELEVRVQERTEELRHTNRALSREIDERHRTEAALRESEKRYRRIFEGAVLGIFQITVEGKIVAANPAFAGILGYDSVEEMLREVSDMAGLHVTPSEFNELVSLMLESGKPVRGERSLQRRGGASFYADLHAWAAYGDDGRLLHLEGFIEDITGRRLAEEKKAMLESQLRQAAKMEAVGTLAGGVAHDFNNLLQVIMGYAQMLLARKENTDWGLREAKEIVRAAKRGGELTKQLLTFSRKVESDLRPVDLDGEIRKISRLLERTVPKMISIELNLHADLPCVCADHVQIEQVLLNLAINSRDAMPDGGRLIIETGVVEAGEDCHGIHPELEPREYVLLTVSDTGHGMDKETLKCIFDPFFTTKEAGKGTGLGLSMIYGIVQSHRGHISCSSEPGQGTTFRIYLPSIGLEEYLARCQVCS